MTPETWAGWGLVAGGVAGGVASGLTLAWKISGPIVEKLRNSKSNGNGHSPSQSTAQLQALDRSKLEKIDENINSTRYQLAQPLQNVVLKTELIAQHAGGLVAEMRDLTRAMGELQVAMAKVTPALEGVTTGLELLADPKNRCCHHCAGGSR